MYVVSGFSRTGLASGTSRLAPGTKRLMKECVLPMSRPASNEIEQGVIDAIKTASRRPIEPTLGSELVADLGFDSLQILDVIAELEGRFDIAIPMESVPAARTVAQVVAEVTRLVDARGAE